MGEEEQQQDKRKLQREWGTSPAAPPPFVVVVSFSRLWLLRLQANKMARACKHLNLFANYAWQPQKRTHTGRQGDRETGRCGQQRSEKRTEKTACDHAGKQERLAHILRRSVWVREDCMPGSSTSSPTRMWTETETGTGTGTDSRLRTPTNKLDLPA